MAQDSNVITFQAGADLSAKQYYFVKLSSGQVVACSATTDRPIGVLQNKPTANQAAEVCTSGWTKVSADAAVALDAVVGTSADGQAATYVAGTDTTKYLMGFCTKAASNAGEIAEIYLTPVARGA